LNSSNRKFSSAEDRQRVVIGEDQRQKRHKGNRGSAPDIHSQTGSAIDASIAEAKAVRESSARRAVRFNAIKPTAIDPTSFRNLTRLAARPRHADSAYQSSRDNGAADSNVQPSIRSHWFARRRQPVASAIPSRFAQFDNFREPIA